MGLGDFFKSVLGICQTEPLDPGLWQVDGSNARISIEKVPQLQQIDGAVYLKGKGLQYPVLVVRAEGDRYLAFANRCTHIGHRKLDPVPGQSTLRCCSVNHSTYDYEGKRISGPAKKDLETYLVELQDGDLIVKL